MTVSPAYEKICVGQMVRLSATLNGPAAEAGMADQEVEWSSTEPTVAEVHKDG